MLTLNLLDKLTYSVDRLQHGCQAVTNTPVYHFKLCQPKTLFYNDLGGMQQPNIYDLKPTHQSFLNNFKTVIFLFIKKIQYILLLNC